MRISPFTASGLQSNKPQPFLCESPKEFSIMVLGRSILLISPLLFSACTYGSKIRVGPVIPPVSPNHVQVLSTAPQRPYRQIGIVSVAGANLSLESQVIRKLQKTAADIGADAVIVTSERDMSLGRGTSTRGEAIKYE